METTTRFDLNQEIQRWRENLGRSPSFESDNLEELESHLRDSISSLEGKGLSLAEAFLIAVRRIGAGDAVESEFGKVNTRSVWLDRFLWMLVGYQVWRLVTSGVDVLSKNVLFFGMYGFGHHFESALVSNFYPVPVVSFLIVQLAGFVGSLAACLWLFRHRGEHLARWFGWWLRNPWSLGLAFGVLCLISIMPWLMNAGFYALLATSVDSKALSEIASSQVYSGGVSRLITTTAFVWLTLLLARKRLKISEDRLIRLR